MPRKTRNSLHVIRQCSPVVLGVLGSLTACATQEDTTQFREVAAIELHDGARVKFLSADEQVVMFEASKSNFLLEGLVDEQDATPLEVFMALAPDSDAPDELVDDHYLRVDGGIASATPRTLGIQRHSCGGPVQGWCEYYRPDDCNSSSAWSSYWDSRWSGDYTDEDYDTSGTVQETTPQFTAYNHLRVGGCVDGANETFYLCSDVIDVSTCGNAHSESLEANEAGRYWWKYPGSGDHYWLHGYFYLGPTSYRGGAGASWKYLADI